MRQDFQHNLLQNFPFTPTSDQEELIRRMAVFFSDETKKKCFVLKGYAGTGKTSFIRSLVKTLPASGYRFSLLAPTGRAAKVISDYTEVPAYTIHKAIYEITPVKGGNLKVHLGKNEKEKTVFIVDEASMISAGDDKSLLRGRNLLDDLMSFAFGANNCCIIFIGDTAQLPPVGEILSPALDEDFLERSYRLKVHSVELKEVVRQAEASGILMNATALRILIGKSAAEPVLKSEGFSDVRRINGEMLQDKLGELYSSSSNNETIIVCRSNRQANRYNNYIRSRLLGHEDAISAGDRLMAVKNNYFWLEEDSFTGFIANGDILQVKRIQKIEKKFEFTFADATVSFPDYPGEGDLEVKLLLDTLSSESPALGQEDQKKLFEAIYGSFDRKLKAAVRLRKTYQDPYFNALQVKFSYAVTCHKAQGGQWPNVFVDSGFMSEAMYNTEYLRWLYTAVTRATRELMFVNMEEKFFRK
jgi:exodeoxyribonuclease-5